MSGEACATSEFLSVASAALDHGAKITLIANPDNGPIATDDETYAAVSACVDVVRDAGVEVVGYVKTKRSEETSPGVWAQRGFRNLTEVEADLDLWDDSGLVDGIFLDEASNLWAWDSSDWEDEPASAAEHDAFYATLFEAVHIGI